MRTFILMTGLLVTNTSATMVAAEPPPSAVATQKAPANLPDRLREAVKPMKLPPGVSINVSLEDGKIVRWEVGLRDSTLIQHIPHGEVLNQAEVQRAMAAWCTEIHQQLYDAAVRCVREAGTDPQFNPQTDISVRIWGNALPTLLPKGHPQWFDQTWFYCTFCGSRMTSLAAGRKDSGGYVAVEDWKALDGIELTVDVSPERRVYRPRETIKGRFRLKNTGRTRIPISIWKLDSVVICDENGREPEVFSNAFVTPDVPARENEFLGPGRARDGEFRITTDPLQGALAGRIVKPGRWVLTYRSLAEECNIPTRVKAVEIEVRTEAATYVGPRILDLTTRSHVLIARREDSRLDVVDVDSGRLLSSKIVEGYNPGWMWFGAKGCISPDGRLMAYSTDRPAPIRIEALYGAPPARREIKASSYFTAGPGGYSAKQFLPDGKSLLIASNYTIAEFDLEKGQEQDRQTTSTMWPELSPDGRFIVDTEAGRPFPDEDSRGADKFTLRIAPRADPEKEQLIEITGHGEKPSMLMGARGIYMTDPFTPGVRFQPYDGGAMASFDAGSVSVECESADGRLVAFAAPRKKRVDFELPPTTIEVWDTAKRQKLFAIAGHEHRRAMFVTDPTRLVCGLTESADGPGFGQARWLSERVIVYDAPSGALQKELDLTPKSSAAPKRKAEP